MERPIDVTDATDTATADQPTTVSPDEPSITCAVGKIGFETRQIAEAEIPRVVAENRGVYRGKKIRAYRCHVCYAWHLTSKPLFTGRRK